MPEVHVTLNGQPIEIIDAPEAGKVGDLKKLRRRKDSKTCREIMEAAEDQPEAYQATELRFDDQGRVVGVEVVKTSRAKVLGMIPGFATKHAHSVKKSKR